ncbi:hypothetical protein HIM_08780 [Hirsutella minnesotensis 3608]|uniref:DJ-1/PfpI domain-containing protein n=1 Tax=Hirsutella minnesotensis 3608 TaxID=1043627 RepID=A0A0F7ZY49_9HYPO|nr:hypothetical protein HIM_08780 [Hirsutella minnesotensis 3608]
MVKAVILMADYGHDPTEAAVPFKAFKDAGFQVSVATETGKPPECDALMLNGTVGPILGPKPAAVALYKEMIQTPEWKTPAAWTSPNFTLSSYDMVFIPGGQDKAIRQVIDSEDVHKLLVEYFPQTKRPGNKAIGAVCHGVMTLAISKRGDGKSAIHDVETTTLPGMYEEVSYWGTRAFLGDYYKTYGVPSPTMEAVVRKALDNPDAQFKQSLLPMPFIVEEQKYNYISGRYAVDMDILSEKLVTLGKQLKA